MLICRPMGFSIKFDSVNSGWFIVYIEVSQVIIFKNYCISFSEDPFSAVIDTFNSGWFIVYIEGSQVIFSIFL